MIYTHVHRNFQLRDFRNGGWGGGAQKAIVNFLSWMPVQYLIINCTFFRLLILRDDYLNESNISPVCKRPFQ